MNDVQTFFVDFDSIFDTRLGTLFLNDAQKAQDILTIDYFRRTQNAFSHLSLEEFNTLYAQRDLNTLKHSVKTLFISILIDFVFGTYKNSINGYEHKKPKIILNIHPYKLEQNDIKEIESVFIELTQGLCLIEFVDMTYEQITPMFLKEQIGAISLYEYAKWLEIHSANDQLKYTTVPGVTLFGPKIFYKTLTQSDQTFLKQNKLDPFEQMEKLSNPFINLKLLDHVFYCADLLPKNIFNENNHSA